MQGSRSPVRPYLPHPWDTQEYILNEAVKRLAGRDIFKQSLGHFALDSTDLETTEHYTGAGKKKMTVRKHNRRGKVVEVVE